MDTRVILRDTGTTLKYVSPIFLLPIIVALIYSEYSTIIYFVITAIPMFLMGIILEKVFATDTKTTLKEGLITVAIIWLFITSIATIPYITILKLKFLPALFETMAAWTTTGFSLMIPEELPKTMLFYRSIQQWFGGIGIVILALAGLFRTGASLYYAEARSEKIKPNILNTIKMIWWIYALYTFVGILLLGAAGMTPFDAVNHGMTAIATGGLSTHSESIGYYNNFYIEFIIIVMMIIGSVSFLSHYELLAGKFRKFFSDVFIRSLFITILIGILLVFKEQGLRTGVFTIVSAISSTGYNLNAISEWSAFSFFVLIILMLIGGGAGATASGIKINRICLVLKSVAWSICRIRHPKQVVSCKLGQSSCDNSVVGEIFKFMLLYFIFAALGIFVFLHEGYALNEAIFQPVSAIGNSGLSMVSDYTPLSMITAIILMWVGRLEIWSVIILLNYLIIRSK
ncbi:MAG: TrkH family potassium uptake protein [Candidatus Aenigmarchaeota archaeon]|nr:TrkH family potassium uptake protein [Candidatus Aenigmarchaeota archaeon]